MADILIATIVELKKLKRSIFVWIVFMVYALVPIMGGVIMYLIENPNLIPESSILRIKTSTLSIPVDWVSYLGTFLTQGTGLVGIIAFGFVASFVFGREYSDNTYRDLLSLPISRSVILNSKYIVYLLLCVMLAISDLILSFVVGLILKLPRWDYDIILSIVKKYFVVVSMVISLGTPISFFALRARGYLAPLGFLIMVLLLANFAPYLGFGQYFPWTIPAIYSGMAGEELKRELNILSYVCLLITSLGGYILTICWWNQGDQR
ncbi:ABC transporter permease [Anaerocellum diazotrophicum]|uniref:Bacitracin ABC transporter permease n=1 Tax=Caldicellulosiruptor diazotrophicus TaxID=2806205 RepID=A0ABM7NN44_9FIRM|nr:ABC transporter permease [Caldicellulosiruptor diazotrophicus]BCS81522.1 bacitracin ABC transporter permease [Caldicellulosiruptor diazotrophicus]